MAYIFDKNSIFTSEAKEYLIKISSPARGEVKRSKKYIFQQLEIKYPQFTHRSFWAVEKISLPRFAFGFALVFVVCLTSYVIFLKKNGSEIETVNIPTRTIAPNETVLVQTDNNSNKVSDLITSDLDEEVSGVGMVSAVDAIKSSNNFNHELRDDRSAVSSDRIRSVGGPVERDATVSARQSQGQRSGVYSVRKEGSVSAASGSDKRAFLDDIDNSVQIEYLVELR